LLLLLGVEFDHIFSLGKHDKKGDKFIVIPITKHESQHFVWAGLMCHIQIDESNSYISQFRQKIIVVNLQKLNVAVIYTYPNLPNM